MGGCSIILTLVLTLVLILVLILILILIQDLDALVQIFVFATMLYIILTVDSLTASQIMEIDTGGC